jgi:hypothetical protein
MKKFLILLTAMIFFMSLWAGPAFAGSTERHRWEGVAIGLGAAILGSAIINNSRPERVTVIEHNTYYQPDPPRHSQRHCEPRQVWIPPEYERVWNPGHYEYGKWVPGQYIMLEKAPGYWVEERICRNYR